MTQPALSQQKLPRSNSAIRENSLEHGLNSIVTSSWLWGTALTFAFYAVIPFFPVYQESVQRYFTAHWIEYATTGLFFVGMSSLAMKLMRIPSERAVLSTDPLEGFVMEHDSNSVTTARSLESHLNLVARQSKQTQLVARIRNLCEYVIGRKSADGLEGHMNYMSELASNRQSDSYALIKTITWAVPILGFLGTVIGITMAIANITPDQLESSLPEVTAGLAVAFDTTALSLGLSMILVFTTFLVERSEQKTLDLIEDYGVKHLLTLFPATEAVTGPLALAESQAADQLLKRTEGMITWQMELWQKSLESLRDRWSSTLSRQQDILDQALQSGLSATLGSHTEQLELARTEFVTAFEKASTRIAVQVESTGSSLIEQQERNAFLIAETWKAFHHDLSNAQATQKEQLADVTHSFSKEVESWNEQIHVATVAMTEQLVELHRQSEFLLKLTDGESELIRLQERLTQNLDSVRLVDSLEETLLNLNAAINLLTSRVKGKAA